MKVDVKKKYSARFEADGTEKAPGEFEPLTELEEKFCGRVSPPEIRGGPIPKESRFRFFGHFWHILEDLELESMKM